MVEVEVDVDVVVDVEDVAVEAIKTGVVARTGLVQVEDGMLVVVVHRIGCTTGNLQC